MAERESQAIMRIGDTNDVVVPCLEVRRPATCMSKWWNQRFRHQHAICRVLESMVFRALVIFLVVTDTALIIAEIMLDYFQVYEKCERPREEYEHTEEPMHLAMEIAHFSSIGILLFFVVELLVKIYAFGKEFWNYRRKKMEYFDAFVVVSSLMIDLYFLSGEEKILGHGLILFFAFRLWRFVRIVSIVAEGVRDGERKHKKRLNKQYLLVVHRLIDLLAEKTHELAEQLDVPSTLEHYRQIDAHCQSSLNELDDDHLFPSSVVVARFLEKLNQLKGGDTYPVLARMVAKAPEL